MTVPDHYDVVICGGGMAALQMARQIQRRRPRTSLLIIDSASAPSPVAAHKVGESTLEGGTYFLRHTLGLDDYLAARHPPKAGLRYFYGGGETPFADRLEFGGTQWPPVAAYQLDRGIVENDLRALVVDGGATVLTDCQVTDVELAEDGGAHRVLARQRGLPRTVTARWVVDATGRRRLIAKKLGLTRPVDHQVSACWWRTEHRIEVDGFVDTAVESWHRRVGPPRWYSTSHLVGEGYWVWIIPLASGHHSIGIVADENVHPLRARSSHRTALAWLRAHEPDLAAALGDGAPLDFKARKNFSYTTAQAFSHHRWSCVGEAAVLTDPLYSLGQDLISHGASITMRLIDLDDAGALSEEAVRGYDAAFRALHGVVLDQFTGTYGTYRSPFVAAQKLAWDSSMYFALFQQTLMQNLYDHPDAAAVLHRTLGRLAEVNRAMQRLFVDCAEREGRLDVHKGMRTWAPRVSALADASVDKCPPERLPAFFAERLAALEEIGAVIFGEVLRHSPSVPEAAVARVLGKIGRASCRERV